MQSINTLETQMNAHDVSETNRIAHMRKERKLVLINFTGKCVFLYSIDLLIVQKHCSPWTVLAAARDQQILHFLPQ